MRTEEIDTGIVIEMINNLEEPTRSKLIKSLKELAIIKKEDPETAQEIIKQIVQMIKSKKFKEIN